MIGRGTLAIDGKLFGTISLFSQGFERILKALGGTGWQLVLPPAAPANAHILVSRNKREGGYLGWRKLGPMQRYSSWDGKKPGHQRVGGELMISTLRQRRAP